MLILHVLKKVRLSLLFLSSILLSIILTEAIVASMSLLFHGKVTYDYLITGAVAAFLVSQVISSCLISLIKELKESDNRFQQLHRQQAQILNAAGEGIYGLDLEGLATFVNPAAAHMIGWEPEELIGQRMHDVLHHSKPDGTSYPAEQCPIYAALRDGEMHLMVDEVFWRKDGTNFPVEYTSTPVSEDGRCVGAVVVFKDIAERKQAEKELEIKGQLLDTATDAIFLHDFDGNLIYVNDTAYKSRGYSKDELLSMNLNQLDTPEYLSLFKPNIRDLIEKGEITIESAHFCKDRSVMPVEIHARLIESQGRKLVLSVVRDITYRKHAEEEYKTILRAAMNGFWLADTQGNILDVNDVYCDITGYSRDELLKMRIQDIEALETPEETAQHIKRLIEIGWDRFETRHRRKDGRILDIEVSAKYMPLEGGRVVAFLRDVTGIRLVEESLRLSEKRYRTLFEESKDTIFSVTPEGTILDINPAGIEMLGYSTMFEVLKLDIARDIYVNPEERKKLVAELEKHSFVKDYEVAFKKKGGEKIIVLITATVLRDKEGRVIAYGGISRDVTEQRRLEREIAEIISQERRRVGHELHDGLGQILTGMAFVCKATEQRLYEKQLPEYKDIKKIKDLLNEAIGRVKDISSGLSPLEVENIGIEGALSRLANNTEDIYKIKCKFNPFINIPIRDRIIAEQLYFIACEAVTNAIRHGKAQNIFLTLHSDDAIILAIEDDGIGFIDGVNYNKGMGLRIMKYRAGIIGASLDIRSVKGGSVICFLRK